MMLGLRGPFQRLFYGDMRGFEVAKVLVVENLEEDAVGVPRRAAADEFAVCGS